MRYFSEWQGHQYWCIIAPQTHQSISHMPRQSITFTDQNDSWLKNHVENIQDYSNKSELVNDLIRNARRVEAINKKLCDAETSGFINQTAAEMLAEFKSELR